MCEDRGSSDGAIAAERRRQTPSNKGLTLQARSPADDVDNVVVVGKSKWTAVVHRPVRPGAGRSMICSSRRGHSGYAGRTFNRASSMRSVTFGIPAYREDQLDAG